MGWVRSLCLSALPSTWRGNQDGYSCSSSALPLTGWRFCDALSDRCFSSGLLILCVSLPGPEAVLAWSRFYRFSDGSGLYSLPGLETLSYPVYCTCTAAEIFTCTADRSTPARPVFSSHPLYFGVFQIKISVFHSLLDPELSVPWQLCFLCWSSEWDADVSKSGPGGLCDNINKKRMLYSSNLNWSQIERNIDERKQN